MTKAILLLAYGGPDSLDDIPEYLLDIRGGRHTPQPLIDEISDRYRQIGGRSPLLDITRSVAAKLAEKTGLPVYVGMRHWSPRIADVVRKMVLDDGIDHIVAIVQAPHYSRMSVGAYKRKLHEAVEAVGRSVKVEFVESWGTEEHYLAGIEQNVRTTLQKFAPLKPAEFVVIFTAHSLPAHLLDQGDPYDEQLRQTARLLAQRLDLSPDRWLFSYQSAAQTGVPWLGPDICEVVEELASKGEKHILVAPIGFIADHVEVLYDLDIELKAIADRHGLTLARPPMLNDSDVLVDALAALVLGRG